MTFLGNLKTKPSEAIEPRRVIDVVLADHARAV
jgi:hypothetical protein